jgi:hypothetical protein
MAGYSLSAQEQAWIVIGKQYGASVSGSGTIEELFRARDLGRQIETRLQAVGGDLSWTLEQLIRAETPVSVPNSATIGFTGVTENSFLVFWDPNGDGGSPITGYHLVIKNEDTGQTITELNTSYNTTSTLIQNLESGTNYKAYVIVINAIGNSFEQSFGVKTLGTVLPPKPEPPVYNFIIESDGLVRMFRLGAVQYTEIKVKPESVQDFINRGVSRLLTAAERAIPYPRVEPEPEPTFCVNVYNIRDSGSVYATSYTAITAAKVAELKLTKFVLSCEATTLPTEKEIQDFYGFTPIPPEVDTSINSTMVSQSVGAFILKDGIIKGEILYIANQSFNPFYYSEIKNLTSFVQIKSKSGIPLIIKPNGLNFTATERDERIQINEGHSGELKNYKEITIDFLVLKSPSDMRAFTSNKQIQVIEEPPPDEPKPCQIGYHKDFSGKCVPDDPEPEIPRDKLIDTLKGFLFGTLALSLLARKY